MERGGTEKFISSASSPPSPTAAAAVAETEEERLVVKRLEADLGKPLAAEATATTAGGGASLVVNIGTYRLDAAGSPAAAATELRPQMALAIVVAAALRNPFADGRM